MQLKCLLFAILVPFLIVGCGGGSDNGSSHPGSRLAASQGCLSASCHGAQGVQTPGGPPKADPQVAGALIGDEWLASAHNLRNAASCADCHEPDAQHPNQCYVCHGGVAVTKNPDAAGKCLKCHGPSRSGDVLMALAPQHFGYSTATARPATTRASYASGQYAGKCRACHNPHNNTLTQQHRDFAKSKHGDAKALAWSNRDFKASKDCIRCHTATGFKAFVTSNFTPPTSGFGAGDASREVLACDACHASYDFKNSVRKAGAFTAPYTAGGSAVTFPDVGASNLCIPCHAGRLSADSIDSITDYSATTGFGAVNSHYLAVAGLMYMKVGFKDFTTMTTVVNPAAAAASRYTYGNSYTMYTGKALPAAPPGQVNSAHRRFGTPLINDDNHVSGSNRGLLAAWNPGTMDTEGPCVTCHLNAHDSNGVLTPHNRTSSHTLAISTDAVQQVCVNCHNADFPNGVTEASVKAFLEENSEDFQEALSLALKILENNYQITYKSTYPYFYDLAQDPTGQTAVKDWTRGSGNQARGRRILGACFNINVLLREPAAYAHARTYARRLVYDTIDYLDDLQINMSVGQTARTLEPTVYYTVPSVSHALNYLCNTASSPERR